MDVRLEKESRDIPRCDVSWSEVLRKPRFRETFESMPLFPRLVSLKLKLALDQSFDSQCPADSQTGSSTALCHGDWKHTLSPCSSAPWDMLRSAGRHGWTRRVRICWPTARRTEAPAPLVLVLVTVMKQCGLINRWWGWMIPWPPAHKCVSTSCKGKSELQTASPWQWG